MKKIMMICVLLTGMVSCASQAQKDVQRDFAGYKNALLGNVGELAVDYLDGFTIRFYQLIQDYAQASNKQAVSELPMIQKLMIYRLRHTLPKADLLRMQVKDLIAYTYYQGWNSSENYTAITIGDIRVKGNIAFANAYLDGKKTKIKYRFSLEDRVWKINMIETLIIAGMVMEQQRKETGLSEDEFIMKFLESVSGKKSGTEIYKPLR